MGKEGAEAVQYEFKDKITARDIEPSYRIKVINSDKIITYSDVKKIRLTSEQQVSIVVGSLWVGIPDYSVVFANVMVSEIPHSENPEITYVGGVSKLYGCTIPAFV